MTALSNPQNGQVAHREVTPSTIKGWLQSPQLKEQVARALPRHCSADRMMRVATTALTRTPDLAKCDVNSFMKCLMDLSQWGLEPDGRHAHLIPFKNTQKRITECQLIIDFKGLVQLLYRAGETESVHADIVREGDDFAFNLGMVEKHVPWAFRPSYERPEAEGEIIAAYCIVKMKGGAVKCEVMTKRQVDAIRARSKAKDRGPWVTDYAEMAKKTVFRRASKWLPISAEIIDAFDRDYDAPEFRRGGTVVTAGPQSLSDLSNRVLGSPEPIDDVGDEDVVVDEFTEPVDDLGESETPDDDPESSADIYDDFPLESDPK